MVLIKEVLATFIATIAFGVLFNIHGKNLFFAGIGGALGSYYQCSFQQLPLVLILKYMQEF